MKNFIQKGLVLALIAPYAVDSGGGAQVGSLFGVAVNTVGNGEEGQFQVEGVFDLPKTNAQAWTQGQKIYWDNANKRCDSDGSVGMLIGVAVSAAADPSVTGTVRLNGVAPSASEGPQAAIPDLVAIAGGEAPTEAEHNLVVAKVNAILAALRTAGIILA